MLKMYFYTSELAHPLDAKKLSLIISEARINNKRLNISGILFFDGARFLQYIEGEELAIEAAKHKINQATSHQDIKILNVIENCDFRVYADWSLGYVHNEDISEEFNRIIQTRYQSHNQITNALEKLTATSDIL